MFLSSPTGLPARDTVHATSYDWVVIATFFGFAQYGALPTSRIWMTYSCFDCELLTTNFAPTRLLGPAPPSCKMTLFCLSLPVNLARYTTGRYSVPFFEKLVIRNPLALSRCIVVSS